MQRCCKTDRADVGRKIETAQLANLPTGYSRNFQSLLNLVPGTTRSFQPHSEFFNSQGSLTILGAGLAADIAGAWRDDTRVVVVSSGAIALGLGALGRAGRPARVAELQAAAAVGQAVLQRAWQRALTRQGGRAAQVLLTAAEVRGRGTYLNARATLETLLQWGITPIVNENDSTATDEITFGDNDALAAQVALMLRARLLVLLTDQDGLFTRDPREPGAELVPEVTDHELLRELDVARPGSAVGSGGMRSKVVAAEMAGTGGVPSVIANGAIPGVLAAAIAGEPRGDALPRRRPRDQRLQALGALRAAGGRAHRRRRRRPSRRGAGRRLAAPGRRRRRPRPLRSGRRGRHHRARRGGLREGARAAPGRGAAHLRRHARRRARGAPRRPRAARLTYSSAAPGGEERSTRPGTADRESPPRRPTPDGSRRSARSPPSTRRREDEQRHRDREDRVDQGVEASGPIASDFAAARCRSCAASGFEGQPHAQRGAAAGGASARDRAAVRLDQAARDREAETRAARVGRASRSGRRRVASSSAGMPGAGVRDGELDRVAVGAASGRSRPCRRPACAAARSRARLLEHLADADAVGVDAPAARSVDGRSRATRRRRPRAA